MAPTKVLEVKKMKQKTNAGVDKINGEVNALTDQSKLIGLANQTPMEKFNMFLGNGAGMQSTTVGNSVGPLVTMFITVTALVTIISTALIVAKEMALVKQLLIFYGSLVLLYVIIFCIILKYRSWLMSNYQYFCDYVVKHFFGDNNRGQIEEGEVVEAYQPEQIISENQEKLKGASKKEDKK